MRAIITAAVILSATSAGASGLETDIYRALGMPIPSYFESRSSCLEELARAIRQAERTKQDGETLTIQLSDRSGRPGAQEAINALIAQATASEAYVSALMTLCQSYD